MSNHNPPLYPLVNAEVPPSCRLKEEDLYASCDIHTHLKSLFTLSSKATRESNIHKKRAASDDSNQNLAHNKINSSDIKRRLTLKDEDIMSQDGIVSDRLTCDHPDESDFDDVIEVSQITPRESTGRNSQSNSLSNVPDTPTESTIKENNHDQQPTNSFKDYENSELPLPSPSASPIQSSYEDLNVVTPDPPLTSSLDVIDFLNLATETLSKNALNHLIFKLIAKSDRSSLSDFRNSINDGLRRDIVSNLPLEISYKILKYLDYKSLNNVLLVSKSWNKLITGEFWKNLLIKDNFITNEELVESKSLVADNASYFQSLYIKRFKLHKNWTDPSFEPRKITVPGHGANVVTCLQFDDEKIISGADDNMINIYNPNNGELIKILSGHEGGVWALKYVGNQIVSGSTDRTVRVWNLNTGQCTHVFKGHTSTIRCMEIVTNEETNEKFIITGSRDSSLHVWKLPDENDQGENYDEHDAVNPYFVCVLRGHTASVRAVTGHGNLIVSGSYDHTVRVWDLKEQKCKFVLRGHTDRIYSTLLDLERNRCISASMDSTIRVWNLEDGHCVAELTKHTSLVGLLGLSSNYLVSAAADGTLRGWNPTNYKNEFTLHHDNHAAITTFHSSPNILVSGSEGQFNVYDLSHNGKLIRSNLLADSGQIWSAKFNYSKCIVAVEKNSQSFIEILDFSKSG